MVQPLAKKILMLFIGLCCLCCEVRAQAPIKIAVFKQYVPYAFIDEQGRAKGMLVDYWRLWAKHSQQDIEFVSVNYTQAMKRLSGNDVDIVAAIYYQGDNIAGLSHSPAYFQTTGNVYLKKERHATVKGLSDLNGLTVGVIKYSPFQSYLQANYPKIKLELFDDTRSMIDASINSQVEALFGETLTIWHHLIKSRHFNEYVRLPGLNTQHPIHAALVDGNKQLNELVALGMSKITWQEKLAIQKNWIVDSELLANVSQKSTTTSLTREERDWLHQHPILNLGVTEDWFPYSFSTRKGEVVGYHIDLIRMINHNLKINLQFKMFNQWQVALSEVQQGRLDGILGASWTPQRDLTLKFSANYLYRETEVITHRANTNINSLGDLTGKKIISFKGQIVDSFIDENVRQPEKIYVASVTQGLELIRNQQADAIILASGAAVASTMPELKVVQRLFTKGGELAIASPKQHELLASILDKGVRSLSSNQKSELLNRWISPPKHEALFTIEELYYIREHPVLLWGMTDALDQQSQLTTVSMLKKISQLSGIEFMLKPQLAPALDTHLAKPQLDLIAGTSHLDKINSDQYVIGNLAFELLVAKKANQPSDINRISGWRIAINKSLLTATAQFKWLSENNVVIVEDDAHAESLLASSKVDALLRIKDSSVRSPTATIQHLSLARPLHLMLYLRLDPKDKILQSIIDKTLRYVMQTTAANEVNSQGSLSQQVNAAFVQRNEPYYFKNNIVRGIEFDLANAVFNLSGNTMNGKFYPLDQIEQVFAQEHEADVMVSIKSKNKHYFYSDSFVTFQDVVVTRKSDNLLIEGISSLSNKSVGAWHLAHKSLGRDYYARFNPAAKPKDYVEYRDQYQQVKDFIDQRIDVIVLDKKIFYWMLNKIAPSQTDDFKFDYIFPPDAGYCVAFKSEALRDQFNLNLTKIKDSGLYQQTISDYVNGSVVAQQELSQFIAALMSSGLATNNMQQLKTMMERIISLEHISYIEVLTTDSQKISDGRLSDEDRIKTSTSYQVRADGLVNVGSVSVAFDVKKLASLKTLSSYLPPLTLFKRQANYRAIRDHYKRFGYLDVNLEFTVEESRYIAKAEPILYTDNYWLPLIFNEGGEYIGVIPDCSVIKPDLSLYR